MVNQVENVTVQLEGRVTSGPCTMQSEGSLSSCRIRLKSLVSWANASSLTFSGLMQAV